jgi:hypothetical protein
MPSVEAVGPEARAASSGPTQATPIGPATPSTPPRRLDVLERPRPSPVPLPAGEAFVDLLPRVIALGPGPASAPPFVTATTRPSRPADDPVRAAPRPSAPGSSRVTALSCLLRGFGEQATIVIQTQQQIKCGRLELAGLQLLESPPRHKPPRSSASLLGTCSHRPSSVHKPTSTPQCATRPKLRHTAVAALPPIRVPGKTPRRRES